MSEAVEEFLTTFDHPSDQAVAHAARGDGPFDHGEELRRVQQLWTMLGTPAVVERLAAPRLDGVAEGSISCPPSLATLEKAPWFASRMRSLQFAAGAASLAILLGSYGVARYRADYFGRVAVSTSTQFYTTERVQTRSVDLADGSRVTLAPQTRLSVQYTPDRRVFKLERGEALFSATHNSARPFVVLAGAGSITALGTQFYVSRESDTDDRVTVVVKEGAVEVGPPIVPRAMPGPMSEQPIGQTWAPARLAEGQAISYDKAGPKGSASNVDVDLAAAWIDGHVEYLRAPLKVVIPRISRYSEKPIVLADEAAGELPFTGSVRAGEVDGLLRALPTVYPIEILELPDRIVIRSRHETSSQ